MKVFMGAPSLRELIAIQYDPSLRFATTPFGAVGMPTSYIGRAVPWKGTHGTTFEGIAKEHGNLLIGVSKIRAMSKAHIERGVAIFQFALGSKKAGARVVMPLKCAEMAREAGHGNIIDKAYNSYELLARAMRPLAPAIAITP